MRWVSGTRLATWVTLDFVSLKPYAGVCRPASHSSFFTQEKGCEMKKIIDWFKEKIIENKNVLIAAVVWIILVVAGACIWALYLKNDPYNKPNDVVVIVGGLALQLIPIAIAFAVYFYLDKENQDVKDRKYFVEYFAKVNEKSYKEFKELFSKTDRELLLDIEKRLILLGADNERYREIKAQKVDESYNYWARKEHQKLYQWLVDFEDEDRINQ